MSVETLVFSIRELLTGGDRRSIADSNRARAMIERDRSLVDALVELVNDDDWLVSQRALDLLEKLSHDHPDWIEPHKRIFIGPLAEGDKWQVRQTFVRAWALDSLASLSARRPRLRATIDRHLRAFERSSSKALKARARNIRARLALTKSHESTTRRRKA
jgi:hypothetical protein